MSSNQTAELALDIFPFNTKNLDFRLRIALLSAVNSFLTVLFRDTRTKTGWARTELFGPGPRSIQISKSRTGSGPTKSRSDSASSPWTPGLIVERFGAGFLSSAALIKSKAACGG